MARRNVKKIQSTPRMTTFTEYQHMVERTDERRQRIISLLGLVGEIGDLHSMVKKLVMQKDNPHLRNELCEEFGDVLWYLTSLASLYKNPLQEIARTNAQKAESFYSPFSSDSIVNFDKDYPADERLPRKFVVNFYQKPLERGVYVKISVNNVVLGDALDRQRTRRRWLPLSRRFSSRVRSRSGVVSRNSSLAKMQAKVKS